MAIKDIRPALRAFLLADAAVSSAVGAARIYPSFLPQGQRNTSLVYARISGVGDHHMQGASGLMTVRMQITAWSTRLDDAEALSDLVQARIDGYRGPMQAGSSPAIAVQGVFYAGENPPQLDQERGLHSAGRDYLIAYGQR